MKADVLSVPSRLWASNREQAQVALVTGAESFLDLEADWTRLWQTNRRREIFTSFAWARAFVETHRIQARLAIAVLSRDGRISAILPLYVADGELRFIGSPLSDYSDLLCDDATSSAEVAALLAALRSAPYAWRRCVLDNLSETARLYQLGFHGKGALGYLTLRSLGHKCPRIVANKDTKVFSELQKKSNPKRCQAKLEAMGELTFKHIEARDEILEHLPRFIEQHRLRRAVSGDSCGIFGQQAVTDFFHALSQAFDPKATLRFAVMNLNGKAIAYHFGFELDGRYVWYSPAFDIDHWWDRPGLVLLRKLFGYAEGRKLVEFDFTIGDEDYKARFANHIGQNQTLILYAGNLAGLKSYAKELTKRSGVVALVRSILSLRRCLFGRSEASVSLGFDRSLGGRSSFILACHCSSRPHETSIRNPADSAVSFGSASLSELTKTWLSDAWGSRPTEALKRIAAGHRSFAVRRDGRIVCLAWVMRTTIEKFIGKHHGQSPVGEAADASIIYEIISREDPESETCLAAFLSFIVSECSAEGRAIWFCRPQACSSERCNKISQADFQDKLLIRFHSPFGWRRPPVVTILSPN